MEKALETLILSASGWRKVFAKSGNEEDCTPTIGILNAFISVHIGLAWAAFLKENFPAEKTVIIGMDSRPTGPEIAECICRACLARTLEVKFIHVSAAPEIMAYARNRHPFVYISASHNPIAHNGIKFGLKDGGVLSGDLVKLLIREFTSAVRARSAPDDAQKILGTDCTDTLAVVQKRMGRYKEEALEAYTLFAREVIAATDNTARQQTFFDQLATSVRLSAQTGKPVGIVADFNGSARAGSIDRTFITGCGIHLFGMHEQPGEIAHRIVPEGESLQWCAKEIERLRNEGITPEERSVSIGYMPDCDGDRGNIVFWNDRTQRAEPIDAQTVFVLALIGELAHLHHGGEIHCGKGTQSLPPTAVAVNDPTSLRVEAVASAFGARTFRAEVGEANVVNLARKLRNEGFIVRVLGEGSNGGNITHPSAVRDPLNTVFAILKLLTIRDTEKTKGLFHLWCELSGQETAYHDDFTMADILDSLPRFVTTSVYEREAILSIRTADHGLLKERFRRVFMREWDIKRHILEDTLGITAWKAISYNGIREHELLDDFTPSGTGGLKVQFYDADNRPLAFIWMRGSATEPVFRILADAQGTDKSVEHMLLEWLTQMVLEADTEMV